MPQVNPENLRWARETAGLSLEAAAHSLGLAGDKGSARLLEIESGVRQPTRKQLVEMAKRYRRPLLALYLAEPPRPGVRNRDMRRMQDPDQTKEALLQTMIRDAAVRQSLLVSALEDEEEADELSFVGSAPADIDATSLSELVRQLLGWRLEDYRNTRSVSDAFSFLRSKVEEAGVYVLLMSNLGNYHTALSPQIFRGFSVASFVAPFVIINDADSRVAWSFTLLHELAHVFLGQSDISGYNADSQIERLCDDVAARLLLPRSDLLSMGISKKTSVETVLAEVSRLSIAAKISRKMIAYNLWRANIISKTIYEALEKIFDSDRDESAKNGKGSAKPDYYVVRRHRLGRRLLQTVDRMMLAGALTAPKAARVLGVKAANVPRLVAPVRAA